MYNVVKIGEKEIPMLCMASVDTSYWHIFHEDPIKLQSTGAADDGDIINFVMKMGFVMAKFAELKDGKKLRALTEDDFLDWLDQFERTDYLNALVDVRLTYEGQSVTIADAKKKEKEPSV